MRRNLLAVVAVVGVLASACASAAVTEVGSAPEPDQTTVVAQSAATEPGAAENEPVATTTTTVQVVLPTGREALAAAEGEPHVLWFWGAN